MTISEMHTVFRVLNQQMGLHLVRGILPESIDVFINMEIQDLINRELMQNAIVETQQNSNYNSVSVSSINTFKTLHHKKRFALNKFNLNNNIYETKLNDFDPLFILKVNLENDSGKIYLSRLINPDLVAAAMADYCSSPDINNPIVTFYNMEKDAMFAVYCIGEADFSIAEIDYIKKPNKVDYNNNVDCDLPEHLHYIIVENAVKRFYNAMSSSVSNNQQNVVKQ